MKFFQLFLLTSYLIAHGKCRMEPYIVNGYLADIDQFPHSAYLFIEPGPSDSYICGASIVNQYLLLTAAHCLYMCTKDSLITVFVGHAIWYEGATATAHSFIGHENFTMTEFRHDIGLVRINTALKFSKNVSRVALMPDPPYNQEASVAGWGQHELDNPDFATFLRFVSLYVKRAEECPERNHKDPGQMCSFIVDDQHVYYGDSGSAVIVRSFIQIGIVSHEYMHFDPPLIIYTDTGYYYNWIEEHTDEIMCVGRRPNKKKKSSVCIIARDGGAGRKRGKKSTSLLDY